jgi:hypothetical protein
VLIFRVPDGALAEQVRCIWLYRGEPPGFENEIVMPTGDPDLVLDLTTARAVASGPSNRPFRLGAGTRREAMGAVLKVGGAATLLGVSLTELRNRRVPLAELWGRSAADLVERALVAQGATDRLEAFQQVLAARSGGTRIRGMRSRARRLRGSRGVPQAVEWLGSARRSACRLAGSSRCSARR